MKGFPEPIEVFAVLWTGLADEVAGAGGWPVPALLRSVPRTAFVGRDGERAVMERSRSQARAGARHVVLVSGEPGIGKSRLASFSGHGAHGEGFAVLWGACSEELAVPYEPWISVCSQLVENAPSEVLERHVERHGGELARLTRELPRRLPDVPEPESSDPETERFLLFSAVAGALVELTASMPVCLVLDDLHWADSQSVALLKHVVWSAESCALQVIVAFRDSDLGGPSPERRAGGSAANPGCRPDRAAGLRGGRGIRGDGGGGRARPGCGRAAARRGNRERDRRQSVLRRGSASQPGGVRAAAVRLDDRAVERRSLGTARLAGKRARRDRPPRRRLGAEAHEVLTLAAVIGRSFELELLVRLMDTGARAAGSAGGGGRSVAAGRVDGRVGRFRFMHALISQTLYEGLGTTRRSDMHHRVAVALEELYGQDPGEHVAELALHWRLAAVDRSKAAHYTARAGRRALDILAPADAAKLFADALDLLGPVDDAERCLALIGLGEAQQLTGDAAYRTTLLHAAQIASSLGDADLAAAAALANTRGFTSLIGHLDDERVDAIERALELNGRADPGRRAQLLALESQELLYVHDRTQRQALATEAIALAREIPDPRVRARVLQHAFHGLWGPDKLAVRTEMANDMLAAAQAAEDRALEFWANFLLLSVSSETGDFALAQAVRDRQRELAAALAQPTLSWVAQVGVAAWAVLEGDLVAAERLARQARELGEVAGQQDALQVFGEHRALVRTY